MVAVAERWQRLKGGMDRDEKRFREKERRKGQTSHALCAWRCLFFWECG